ncbi:hypothetical protein V3N99_17765 [Dermatophilaceae bacterium Soc4.6]
MVDGATGSVRTDLVVSQDATTARSVLDVTRVTVGWAPSPTPVAAPLRGDVVVRLGRGPVSTLQMAALRRHAYAVTVRTSTLLTVVSPSGASSTITLGEELSARKQMGFSFAQDGSGLASADLHPRRRRLLGAHGQRRHADRHHLVAMPSRRATSSPPTARTTAGSPTTTSWSVARDIPT